MDAYEKDRGPDQKDKHARDVVEPKDPYKFTIPNDLARKRVKSNSWVSHPLTGYVVIRSNKAGCDNWTWLKCLDGHWTRSTLVVGGSPTNDYQIASSVS